MLAGLAFPGMGYGQADVLSETVAGPGWRKRWRPCAIPIGSRVPTPAVSSGHSPAVQQAASNGFICSHS